MIKTIDVGLMANHLDAHKGVIKRLELYMRMTKNQQLVHTLNQQIGAMKNHVKVMNQLLDPTNTNPVTLPPIPQNVMNHGIQSPFIDTGMVDRDITFDALFTANAIANDNFISSSNMKNQQVKQLHAEMAKQQSHIANQYEMLAEQLGWLSHPDATNQEQTQSMSPLPSVPPNNVMGGQHQTGQQYPQ